jgi:hypothetical protein
MGWCQGRVCGFATAGIAACLSRRETSPADLRSLATRSLALPVPLGELARLADAPAPVEATDDPQEKGRNGD